MPLQNRVDPFGELIATPERGLLLGNRGGRFHTDAKSLTMRRWASRQWICCELDFKGRRRDVWGRFYTELFFLDEPTALAAGHRPCFECRRKDAEAFAQFWCEANGLAAKPKAAEMDAILHKERLHGHAKRTYRCIVDELPDGVFVVVDDEAFAIRGSHLLRWAANGYATKQSRPRGVSINVLTPLSTVAVLSAGYRPRWHPSAD